jgi:hypothetical protein
MVSVIDPLGDQHFGFNVRDRQRSVMHQLFKQHEVTQAKAQVSDTLLYERSRRSGRASTIQSSAGIRLLYVVRMLSAHA